MAENLNKNNVVKVIEPISNRYAGYTAFFRENKEVQDRLDDYIKSLSIDLIAGKEYKLIFVGKHWIRNYPLFLIEDELGNIFLVDKHALEK